MTVFFTKNNISEEVIIDKSVLSDINYFKKTKNIL